ncbi:hypothetical protein [Brachyspira murdochii]|uniref:Lipoprotein n=2 Tax=Brachyspira murdochii TaxID=84378 RepID=D5U8U7_BRAM5|nr:hypothetical protein [Brachyspira murdochii]ADG71120.1 hypothetical protein Bmur_1024 [Brachyspira murdochii DSM 12563]PPS22882.1 hypothetical protein DJ52_02315 [Brachyspira murdochii]
MSKKISTIFLTLFLVGVLSVSCSNKDKTAPDTSTPKTIDPKYSGIWSSSNNPDAVEIDINGNIYEYNSTRGNKGEVLEANDPSYKVKIYGREFTITFSSDAKNATVNIDGQEITYTKTSQGIEQYSGNTYVSTQTFDLSNIEIFGEKYKNAYVWVSVNNDMIAVFPNDNNTTAPNFSGNYMSGITGYGTDYNISSSYNGQPNAIKGTLKFSDNSVTVRFTENPGAPAEFLNKDIVCNKKQQ